VPSISAQKRNGNIVGYSVYLGTEGVQRRQRRFFVHRSDAEKFVAQKTTTPVPVGELWERKAEILYSLERLRPVGTNLVEVVSFYLDQRGSSFGQKMFGEVVAEFLKEKRQVGRSDAYERNLRKCFTRFLTQTGGDRRIGEITRQVVADYVYRTHQHLSNVSKKNLLTNFSVVLNHAVKRDYLQTNPVEKIDRPTIPFVKPSVMSPADFEKLLRRCHQKGWHDRLVIFVLVGLCGIRTEEASRLKWTNLDFVRKIVEVPASVAKKASFRNNVIPANAMAWLEAVADKRRTGPLIGPRWRNQLRSAVVSSKSGYEKNSIRHSFCSYALAAGWPLVEVVQMMGHGGSPTMVFSHYRNVVSSEVRISPSSSRSTASTKDPCVCTASSKARTTSRAVIRRPTAMSMQ
jgi:site-specific recombinase XerD